MKKGNIFKIVLILMFVICSCSKVSQYIPPTLNAPQFRSEHEGMIQAFAGLNHIELQGGYSFSKKFATIADVWLGLDGRFSIEAAPGLYQFRKDHISASGFLGLGVASASTNVESSSTDIISGTKYTTKYETTAPYQYVFFQPSLGYRHDFWEIAFIPRITYLHYADFYFKRYEKDNNYQRKYVLKENVDIGSMSGAVFQPTLMIRAGLKNIKVFVATSVNMIVTDKNWHLGSSEIIPYFQPFQLSVGLHLRFGGKDELIEIKENLLLPVVLLKHTND